jgi:hypothetical protein
VELYAAVLSTNVSLAADTKQHVSISSFLKVIRFRSSSISRDMFRIAVDGNCCASVFSFLVYGPSSDEFFLFCVCYENIHNKHKITGTTTHLCRIHKPIDRTTY